MAIKATMTAVELATQDGRCRTELHHPGKRIAFAKLRGDTEFRDDWRKRFYASAINPAAMRRC